MLDVDDSIRGMMPLPLSALALMKAQAAVPTLGTLPRQQLPERGCAAYLWTVQDQRFVAMVEPTRLRLSLDGKLVDLAATQAGEGGALGVASGTRYAGGGVGATLTMTIAQRGTVQDGAIVSEASLSTDRHRTDRPVCWSASVR